MNKRFYFLRLSVGMAILLSALSAPYFFTFSRSHVVASSAQAEPMAPVSFQTGCSTASFSQAATSPETAGNNPHFVATGDLNGDTHLDIVSTDFDSASVTILLGDGTGNFTIFGSPIPVGTEPVTAELGDYNNDTKLDFAVCNQNSDNVSVFLGNGNGTFVQAAGSPVAVGDAPRTVVKGHFNGDSNLDLLTTNGGSNNLTVMLGNGDGTFTTSTLAGGFAPFHAVVANFNADGNADLAVANFGGGTVSIFLGNGSGGFTLFGSEISVGTFTSYIAIGLYNADANLDLAVTNRLSNNVAVLLGDGSGGFSAAAGSPYTVGAAPMAVATADLNLDGVLDLAVANEGTANTTILLGNGTGGFGSPTVVTKGLFPTHVALADFNEDGKPDIATPDGGDDTITILLNTCNNCAAITVNPTTISSGTVNATYSETFTASGGTSPHTFSLTGALPTGLSFTDPTLSGIPTQSGIFPITVTTMDNNGCTGNRNYTLVVNCQSITVNPTTIATGTVNTFYNQSFTQTGGFGTTTFSLSGALPTGLSFSGSTLSGTPTQSGSFPITVTATDSNGCTGNRGYTLVVNCQTITVNPATIPNGTVNSAYSETFTHVGGIGATIFALTGTLPTGLSFSGATLSGTPTQTGSFPITVTATDSNGCAGARNYTLVINCQSITVNPSTIPNGTVSSAYSQTFTHVGGIGATTFALTGTLPTGLSFSGATLSGTPTQTGSFPITVTATDSNGCTGNRGYTLVINCQAITVNPTTIPNGTANSVYSQAFTQTGGIGATTFSLTGALPTGLSFSGATLSGTPTQTGSFPITVTATDSNGCTGNRNYTLVINCQSLTVNPTTISSGTAGMVYSQAFTQTGGIGTITFSLTGALPTGLSLSGSTLSGTPTQVGNFPITVTATDSNGCAGSRNYTLTINCPIITVNPTTISSGTISTTYSQTFTQTGGIGSTTFALTGTLPTGLSFSGATLSGTPTQTGSFPIMVTATDANGCAGSRAYTLIINCSGVTVTPTTIPSGTVNTVYSQTFTQTGGVGTTTFSLTGTLPTGLSLAGATLSGTPTQSGSFPITVIATDSNGCTGSRNYTLTINCQTISILPATIPAGTAGTGYSQSFTANGAIGTVTFAQNGKLPAGITFSGSTLSGTPTQTGSFPISITATDANNCSTTRNYTLTINCQALTITPTTISAGTVNSAYSQTFTQTGGIGSVTFTQSGKLPTGMSFASPTLSGTPTQTGSFPISITATDSNGCSVTRNFTLTINCQTITVNPATIAGGTVGTSYSQTFTQTGGVGTVNFSLTGALPTGLSLSGATLSGTPTQSGSFPIAVIATDSNGCTGTRNYTLLVNCQGFTINPATLPAGTLGAAYFQTLSHTGGTGSVSFNLTGALPTGLSFSGVTLSGTPSQTGSFPVTVTATDSNGCTASRNYTLAINCQTITINPTTIPAGTAGTAYSQGFTQTGGIGTTTLSLTGTLPTGLSFAGGTLSGVPTQTGSFPITVTATDSNGCAGSRNYTLVINCQTITVNPATIPAGTAGTAYSQGFTQVGGIGTTTFSLTGKLPTGLSFAGGTLSGVPTQTGSFPITVTATDSNGCTGSRAFTLVINCPAITVNPATLPNGFVGINYGSQTLSATGGIGAYTFTVSAGALPGGLTISGSTLTGTPTTGGTFNFTLQAADSNGCVGTRAYTVTISGGAKGTGLQFYPLATPVRLLDTRSGQTACSAPGAQIPGNTSLTQSAAGFCSIPANAQAVVGNITTVQSGGGFLTLYPSDATRPTVANSNYAANEVLNNAFTVGLGAADGAFKIFVTTNTNVVVDVTGYYAPPGAGGLYYHKLPTPIRLLETRPGQTGCFATGTPLPGGVDTTQQGTTTCGGVTIPSSAKVLYGNATTVSPVAGGFLTLFAADITRPGTASGNYTANQVLNSPFYVGLSASGQFKIFTTQQTHLVVDIHGYYSADAVDVNGQGLLFTPLPTPVRLLDTRAGFSGCFTPGAPLQSGIEQSQLARGTCTIGASAQAIVGNATVVNNPAIGFLTLWPSDATRPTVASSNWTPNKVFNRFFTVGLGANGNFKMFANTGTDLVVDVSGYFAP
ncbi:MAG: putative Ig domain-containing protein [Blastocatellia bacterium]